MKFLILVSSLLALASASWEPVHEKYHGPLHYPKIYKGVPIEPAAVQHARKSHLKALYEASNNHGYSLHDNHNDNHEHKWQGAQHYPVIHNGLPVETPEVQHARESHLKALTHAAHYDHSKYFDQHENEYYGHHEEGRKWNGPLHYPKIHNGVPVEPVEVQHARAAHLKAFHDHGGDYSYSNQHNVHHHEEDNHYETPKIGHDGKPLDTLEVEAAKSKHFAAVHDALARNSHGISHHYRKRRGAESYVHFNSVVEHEVPVYQHENYHHQNDDEDESQYYGKHEGGYSHQQIHAPVYGHDGDEYHNSDHHTYAAVEHQQSSHGYSYEQIHAPVYGHHDAYQHEIPVIGHDGVPVDTPEVQHARAAHLAAHAAAKSKHY